MNGDLLNVDGKLQDSFLPAMYSDSCVLIEYWMTEGMEMPPTETDALPKKNELPHLQVIRDILKSDRKTMKLVDIRKKLIWERPKVTPIVSPLALLELTEWYAGASFKQIAS